MSDLILRTTSNVQATRYAASQTLVKCARGVSERVRREQTGQDLVEYGGVLLVVAALILFVVQAVHGGIGSALVNGIIHAIQGVFAGGGGGQS